MFILKLFIPKSRYLQEKCACFDKLTKRHLINVQWKNIAKKAMQSTCIVGVHIFLDSMRPTKLTR